MFTQRIKIELKVKVAAQLGRKPINIEETIGNIKHHE